MNKFKFDGPREGPLSLHEEIVSGLSFEALALTSPDLEIWSLKADFRLLVLLKVLET